MRSFGIVDALRRGLFGTPSALAVAAQVDAHGLCPQLGGEGGQRDDVKHRPVLGIEHRVQTFSDVAQYVEPL
jgi:hypothetical protein